MLRSMLFVPADSEKKLARSVQCSADALILDLEDSVAPSRKPAARTMARDFLERHAEYPGALWVRINPIGTADADKDLEAVLRARPDGIVVPKASPAELLKLSSRLDVLETANGMERGTTKLLPITTERPASLFSMGEYRHCGPRLAAMSWGAEDLSVALDAVTNVDEDGDWLFTYRLARSLCLLAAGAADVAAIDTVYTDFRDPAGLMRQTIEARRDGFSGKLAIHPEQIDVIHQALQPSAEEITQARRVVAAFEQSADRGVVALDGRMLDRPHLEKAKRVLAHAARS